MGVQTVSPHISALSIMVISGFISPVDNMSEFLQVLAQFNPLKYFLDIVLGSFLKSMTPAGVFANLWPMALIGVVTVTSASIIVRRSIH